MTPERIAELTELCEKATPGPWAYCPQHIEEGPSAVRAGNCCGWLITTTASDDDACFIALARSAIPFLIARLEAAEARAEQLQSAMNMAAAGQPALLEQARNEGIEAAVKVLQAMEPEYNDGPSMHVENMTLGRAVLTIRALLKDKPNG